MAPTILMHPTVNSVFANISTDDSDFINSQERLIFQVLLNTHLFPAISQDYPYVTAESFLDF